MAGGWLILTSHVGDKVRLRLPDGRFVWVQVVDVDRGKVRVGFRADRDIQIMRDAMLPEEERYAATH